MDILIPGATTTDNFTLPVDRKLIDSLTISYIQDGKLVLTKAKEDCSISGTYGTVVLSQEDTLKFSDVKPVQVQIIVKTTGNNIIPSNPFSFPVGVRLNREVL